MAIAFAGTAPFGASILEGLLEQREVALVVSQPDRPAGRGKQLRSPAVAELAKERGLRLLQPEKMHEADVLAVLEELGITTIIVAAFGQMIREPLLSDYLMINVHGSMLPMYRGAAPIERSIMDGHSETGVAIMKMDAGLDTGPVAIQEEVSIEIDDDAGDIYRKTSDLGVRLLVQTLDQVDAGTVEFADQPETGETYAHKIVAEDRALDFAAPARAVHDRIRALSPHIGAFAEVDGLRLTLWKTRIASLADLPFDDELGAEPGSTINTHKLMFVRCGDGILEVLELQPAGKRRMPTRDWLGGLRSPVGKLGVPAKQQP